MTRIAIDMDGVLADVYSQFIKLHAEEFNQVLSLAEMEGRTEEEAFPNLRTYVHAPHFFRDAPVVAGSQHVLQQLNEKYEVFIVSSATEFPNSLTEKQSWLNEHFPFISWQQIVFCGSKKIIDADIMIDDHFKNLDHFKGATLLYTQPHNKLADAGRHRRVENWTDIQKILLT